MPKYTFFLCSFQQFQPPKSRLFFGETHPSIYPKGTYARTAIRRKWLCTALIAALQINHVCNIRLQKPVGIDLMQSRKDKAALRHCPNAVSGLTKRRNNFFFRQLGKFFRQLIFTETSMLYNIDEQRCRSTSKVFRITIPEMCK